MIEKLRHLCYGQRSGRNECLPDRFEFALDVLSAEASEDDLADESAAATTMAKGFAKPPRTTSIVFNDPGIADVSVNEAKTEPPSNVDPDAVLAATVPANGLEMVSGREADEFRSCGCIRSRELATGHAHNVRKPAYPEPVAESHCVNTAKTSDHDLQHTAFRYTER